MYKGYKTLALIPARGGSKGLPGKNVRPLLGKPLIAWTIEAALSSSLLDMVVVSTDDGHIAEVARSYGAQVPFLRPAELATDGARTIDAVSHAIGFLSGKGMDFDAVALLEPTEPLRKDGDIDNAIRLLFDNPDRADAVISLGEIHLESPFIAKKINRDGYLSPLIEEAVKSHQRQGLEKTYFPYGIVYLARTGPLLEKETFYLERTLPMFIERWQNYEVDDIYDFIAIEAVLKYRAGEAL